MSLAALSGESIHRQSGVMSYFVYILASERLGTLYVGVTNDLPRRIAEHKQKLVEGFTKTYGVDKLMYFEAFDDVETAIKREKRLKRYKRDWKIKLIEENNPNWADLYPSLFG